MPRDSRLSNPGEYVDEVQLSFYAANPANKINRDYGETYRAGTTQPPFEINAHFDASNLRKRIQTRKLTLNPRLNFVGGDPGKFQLFTGTDRFDSTKEIKYDFDSGRPNTPTRFTEYPEFKEMWAELYFNSPTIEEPIRNPMPRISNVDPLNNIFNRQESRAENEVEGNKTVAQILAETPKKTIEEEDSKANEA